LLLKQCNEFTNRIEVIVVNASSSLSEVCLV